MSGCPFIGWSARTAQPPHQVFTPAAKRPARRAPVPRAARDLPPLRGRMVRSGAAGAPLGNTRVQCCGRGCTTLSATRQQVRQ